MFTTAAIVVLTALVALCIKQVRQQNRAVAGLASRVNTLGGQANLPPDADTAARLLRLEAAERARSLKEALE